MSSLFIYFEYFASVYFKWREFLYVIYKNKKNIGLLPAMHVIEMWNWGVSKCSSSSEDGGPKIFVIMFRLEELMRSIYVKNQVYCTK